MTSAEKTAVHLYVEEGKSQQEVMIAMRGVMERAKVRELLTNYTDQRLEKKMFISQQRIKELAQEIRQQWTPQQAGRRWIARSESSRERLARAASQMLQ